MRLVNRATLAIGLFVSTLLVGHSGQPAAPSGPVADIPATISTGGDVAAARSTSRASAAAWPATRPAPTSWSGRAWPAS
jgi:hypothetical protein